MKMEHAQCSEALAFKLQLPGNNPEEMIWHSKQCESLKLRSPGFLPFLVEPVVIDLDQIALKKCTVYSGNRLFLTWQR
jgi:uncharacterized protein Smg (DUF494 family)